MLTKNLTLMDKFTKSDTVFVGGISLWGYILTYVYLVSKAQELSIPAELVFVSLEHILITLTIMMAFFFSSILGYDLIMSCLELHPESKQENLRALVLIAFTILSLFAGHFLDPFLYLFILVPGSFVITLIVMACKESANFKDFYNRLLLNFGTQNRSLPTQQRWLSQQLKGQYSFLIFACITSYLVAVAVGHLEGKLVFNKLQGMSEAEALIAKYGDMLIYSKAGNGEIIIRTISKDDIPPIYKNKSRLFGVTL